MKQSIYISLKGALVHTTMSKNNEMKQYNIHTAQQSDKDMQVHHNVYDLHVKKDLVQYLHACCFHPVPSTWAKARRRGYFVTWLGLSEKLIQ